MLFPIIKIKDSDSKIERIVGTNHHDVLEIKDGGKVLSYMNIQNMCDSQYGPYEFTGKRCEYEGTVTVEFVTFEEIEKIYAEYLSKEKENGKIRTQIFENLSRSGMQNK